MKATLEPIVFVMRLHPNDGVPYVGAATVSIDEFHVATIKGMTSDVLTPSAWRAVMRTLASIGVVEIVFTRRKPGRPDVIKRIKVPHDGTRVTA